MREIKYIVLHCTGGPQSQTVADIQAYWKRKGWRRPGYHFMIDPAGIAHELQPIASPSNGVKGFNANAIHISYIGGVGAGGTILDNRTAEQKKCMQRLVEDLHKQFPAAAILGHRDFSPDKNRNGIVDPAEWMKSCPSFSVREWLQEINLSQMVDVPLAKKAIRTDKGGFVNVRSGPGMEHDVIAQVANGRNCLVTIKEGNWSFVEFSSSLKGWVRSDFIV